MHFCAFDVFYVPYCDFCSSCVVLLQPLVDFIRKITTICPRAGYKEIFEILMTTLYKNKYSKSLNTRVT